MYTIYLFLYENIPKQTLAQLVLSRDYPMNKKLSLLFTAMFLGACAQDRAPLVEITNPVVSNQTLSVVQAIPNPSQMVADVSTNGRVSTIKNIDVAYVGKQIPFTFSHGKVENTVGFEWYVSKHFALKTDYPAKKAKFFLELLELSYPYYVEFFGMEPPNIEQQRIASTYATSNNKLRDAMFDDGFNRGIHHTAGGEAMYYNWVGYSFPTERPQHQRYISIHETMHSYQMALGNYPWTPSWHGEGLGDSTANHVFDSEKKQLTVFGHDVPIFDMMSWGLATYKKEKPSIVEIHNRPKFDRGLNVLFVQFMFNNPEYSQYLKIYHQEVMRQQTNSRTESLKILQSIVPDWEKLETQFTTWVSNIDETHEVASGGQWEMDGNMYYKRKSSYDYAPQRLGFNMTPAQTPVYKPFKTDFPMPDKSDLLLDIQRGVDEPTLGYELKYQKDTLLQGSIGMSFGAKSTPENIESKKHYRSWKDGNTDLDQQLRIEVQEAKTLIIDGSNFGSSVKKVALPANLVTSLQNQIEPKLGVSVQFKKAALVVTLKTANADTFEIVEPITAQQHSDLINRTFGLVSSDNQHGITPHMDDGRDLNPNMPNYNQTTAANVWGFKGDKLANRFARASFKAGKNTPQSWRKAFEILNKAALTPTTAGKKIAQVEALLPQLMLDASSTDKTNLNDAKAELSGIQLQVDWLGSNANELKEYAIVTNHSKSPIKGKITFNVNNQQSKIMHIDLKAGEKLNVLIPADLLSQGKSVITDLDYNWQGTQLTQQVSQKTKQYRGFELPQINAEFENDALVITALLNGPFAGETNGIITFDLYHGLKKQTFQRKVDIKPYEEQKLRHIFKVTEKDLDHDAWFEVTVVADSDGEPLTLRKRLPYTPKKFNR